MSPSGAEKGKVVVRFPPEASGYLHIGHAKAALLNNHYKTAFDGKLVFRFDDTNPDKENVHFEDVIREDVKMLQIVPDVSTYTSDYFDLYIEKCVEMIKAGKAYVDDTPGDVMREEREARTESKNRSNSVQKNLDMWNQMVAGTEDGQKCCVRAKIDMQSPNGCLRDPALFRCKKAAHPRTGNKYVVYPTYDFACPIIDSIEGVTHALRTTEYCDRDIQYSWILEQLNLRKPVIQSYSRLNLQNTVLSKRKLTWFVDQGIVDGWDDPRMPTVRGVLRRGLTVEGLKQFIVSQGSSKATVFMEWDKIWGLNKKVIDEISQRFAAVVKNDHVVVEVTDGPVGDSYVEVAVHPKNPEMGKRQVRVGNKILVDTIDANEMKPADVVTFVNWGNLKIVDVVKSGTKVTSIRAQLDLDNKNFKKTLKATWIEASKASQVTFIYYDHLISKAQLMKDDKFEEFVNRDSVFKLDMLVEADVLGLKKGTIIQVLRKGYFIVDQEATGSSPPVLISIPDGTFDMNIFPTEVRLWKEKNKKIQEENDAKSSAAAGDKLNQDVNGNPQATNGQAAAESLEAIVINQQIAQVGDVIRVLKSEKKSKDELQPSIDKLLQLKAEYKKITGKDWQPAGGAPAARAPKPAAAAAAAKKPEQPKAPKQQPQKPKGSEDDAGQKKQTRLCIEYKKDDNFADWYSEVLTKTDMIEYYDISGCYVLRPWAFSIWEFITKFFDDKIKSIGVENCYFPMFVTQAALEKEKAHIADFAPEVAWVTKSGSTEMEVPIAIRPTSETVMYPSYAKWVKSHRDLPLKLNQWCNVVRWEFKNPTPFLRTREFLWQEGHTAYADRESAVQEVYQILDFYAAVYEELLAVPVIKGRKTEKEKFPGGDFTTTIEGFIPTNGRGIQAATSHHLGQNFSKMFQIEFQDPDDPKKKKLVYQNSWGLTTRSIGVMVMTHADDKGLVLPPRVAKYQVVIVPCGITANTSDDEKNGLYAACQALDNKLTAIGIRVKSDLEDHYSPGWKYNHWELKGVPLRIELGPKDLAKNQFVAVRRDDGLKITVNDATGATDVFKLLNDIQKSLYSKAKDKMNQGVVPAWDFDTFKSKLDDKKLLIAPFCGDPDCEELIKKNSEGSPDGTSSGPLMGAKSLCIPSQQPRAIDPSKDRCIYPKCSKEAQFFTLFGRSY